MSRELRAFASDGDENRSGKGSNVVPFNSARPSPARPSLEQHQEKEQDQGKEKDQVRSFTEQCPTPGVIQSKSTGQSGQSDQSGELDLPNALDQLIELWQDKLLEPVEVELGPLPPRARDVQRHMAQYMKTLFGLRYAVGEYRPMPFAASVPVRRGIVDDKGNASRVIRSLVVMRVVLCVGALAPLEERGPLARDHGTKLYTPPQPKGET